MAAQLSAHLESNADIRVRDFPEGHHTNVMIPLGDMTEIVMWLGRSDEEAVTNADRLIEALHELRTHCLARIVKSKPEAVAS